MKILSLFDGMSCGMIALKAAGIQVEKYIAYEIDKYAIQTSSENFPEIEHKGDVFKADFSEYKDFDFLIGGSPCTYWSIAQTKNRETTASGMGWELFSQYTRALQEVKPKYFLYENNKSMSAAIRESITGTFGFEPICINSALVSAQNRQRLYWCGIRQPDGSYKKADIEQPEDRGILLKNILETDMTLYKHFSEKEMDYMTRDHQDQRWSFCNKPGEEDKSKCLVANVHKGVPYNIVAQLLKPMKYELENVKDADSGIIGMLDMKGQEIIRRVYGTNGKAPTLTTCSGGHREPKIIEQLPPCFKAKEATKKGYTEIKPGNCVDMEQPNSKTRRGRNMENKSNCLNTSCQFYQYYGTVTFPIYEVKNGFITTKGKQYPIKLIDGFYIIRKLTVLECKRLQTVPDNYRFPVSDSQAYKMLGNGWTVEIIKHLMRGIINDKNRS